MLEVQELEVQYGAIAALHGVSLNVKAGEAVALLGANGAGKSSTLKAIAGLERPKAGKILFDGQPIHMLSPRSRVQRGICLVPEGRHVFPRLTVAENLRAGAMTGQSASKVKEALEQVYTLFPRLLERREQAAGTLSGGEQQMVAIGRALMAGPRLLLLDEPTLGIAPQLVEVIFKTLQQINKSGTTVLVVEQNVSAALFLAARGYVLQNGRVAVEGTTAELAGNPAVRQAYLGV